LRRRGLPQTLLLLALSAATLQGCAELSYLFHKTPPPAPAVEPAEIPPPAPPVKPAERPPPAPPVKPAERPPPVKPPEIPVADKLFAEGMAAFKEGRFERALELYSGAWKEQPGHAGVAREFDNAVLALKKSGDAAYAQRKWEDAGKRWMGTLRYIAHPAANWRGYPFTQSEIRAKVDALTAALTQKALTEYRRGDVSAAIVDWKTILSYDPGNEEAARSLQTATKQLETLKKMPPGK